MLKPLKAIPLLAATLCLGACATQYSEAPLATNFRTAEQPKLQAASHWGSIAQDVALQLKPSIGISSVYVTPPKDQSSFSLAFHNQLISSLVNAGVAVSKTPRNALGLEVETQLVRFSPERYQNRHFVSATAITGGLWAVHGLSAYPQTNAMIATLGIAGALDWNQWFNQKYAQGETPQHELIVTSSLSDSLQFVGRRTDVYYISDGDSSLYGSNGKTLQIVGGE